MSKKRIALFASGSGSNAENIIRYFKDAAEIEVVHVFCNNPNAFVLQRAQNLKISYTVFTKKDFQSPHFVGMLQGLQLDGLILAGFLWLIPESLVAAFPHRIINIHPALLPKFGGKGMFGHHVHGAVIEAKETESGITIHLVNEHYDQGAILSQHACSIDADETSESLAQKIAQLEMEYFPKIVEEYLETI